MNVLIVEDEPIAAKKIEAIILRLRPNWKILAKIESIKQTVETLNHYQPDVIFLDIHLSDGKSFEIFDHVNISSPIIFTTAYDQYALKAFEQNSIDYLLKPITKKNVERAINKLEQFSNKVVDFEAFVKSIKVDQPSYQKRFMVFYGNKIKTIPVEDVAYFFSESKQTLLATKQGEQFIIDATLDKLQDRLNPENFFRINRGFIVEIASISEMEPYTKSRVALTLNPPINKDTIVSVERSSKFKKWLNR